MKVPYSWLSDWIDLPWPARELGERLTLAGFELESLDDEANDPVLNLAVTPNRGDAMSVLGVAREIGALAGQSVTLPTAEPVLASRDDIFPVRLVASAGCASFVGRVIKGIDVSAESPPWLRARLQQCGIRSINPVVDVTNYTMLELGTPMHGYDLGLLQSAIDVRLAALGETLRLLDGQDIELAGGELLIADAGGPIGLAGVMGGERTAVSERTIDVFFELAYFEPTVVGVCARRHGLITDAAQRFERGVDYRMQEYAMERATRLLLDIAGGEPGPVTTSTSVGQLPHMAAVRLRRRQLDRLTGADIPAARVQTILQSLGMAVQATEEGWSVTPPSHRFDIGIEADLIEEVARIFGYDAITEQDARIAQTVEPVPETRLEAVRALQILADRGYQEAISYSFVDPKWQQLLFADGAQLQLSNPIASDMSAMRVSLWPGLLTAVGDNLRRQQKRVRLAEFGSKFLLSAEAGLREVATIAGAAVGEFMPQQWGEGARGIDFFDMKADVQALLEATGCADEFSFRAEVLDCLHPGRSARILRGEQPVGWLGELHPQKAKALDLTYPVLLFELETEAAFAGIPPVFTEISKYPSIRRDIAVVVDEAVALATVSSAVQTSAGGLLRELVVFDVYRGAGVDSGRKSIALGLILQETSRTLTDSDADRIVGAVLEKLRREFNASIRDQ